MSKTPITWLELIKMKLKEEKDKGKSPSIGDVTPIAKKEWVEIKEGKHPKYMQGKAKTYARKKSKNENKKSRKNSMKSEKNSPMSSPKTPSVDIQELLNELKLCGKCKKKASKFLSKKNMSGGSSCGQAPAPAPAPASGGCGSTCAI